MNNIKRNKMMTTEQWLEDKILDYKSYPTQTLEDMLVTTTSIMERYLTDPNNATKGLFESCVEHNKLFLTKINLWTQEEDISTI